MRKHFNKFVIWSCNFIGQTHWAELNQLQHEMTNAFLIVRLDVTLSTIETLKFTLNQHLGCRLAEWVDLLVISSLGIKNSLVVVTAVNGLYSLGMKLHGLSPSANV